MKYNYLIQKSKIFKNNIFLDKIIIYHVLNGVILIMIYLLVVKMDALNNGIL